MRSVGVRRSLILERLPLRKSARVFVNKEGEKGIEKRSIKGGERRGREEGRKKEAWKEDFFLVSDSWNRRAVEPHHSSKVRREPTTRAAVHQDVPCAIERAHPVAPLPALVAILRPWRRKNRGQRSKERSGRKMSVRVSGVYLVPASATTTTITNSETNNEMSNNNLVPSHEINNQQQAQQQQQYHHHHHHHDHHQQQQQQRQQQQQQHKQQQYHATKTVTIATAPQRSNSLDYLNFEEKRQIIASSLSLSDFLAHGPAAAAAAAAKEVAANTVIGEYRRIP